MLIQQHGHPVYFESFGVRDLGSTQPMTADTIFRLYSMSKPITSVAAMMLVEDGKLRLDDPVSKYIPVFADVKVGVERADASGKPWLTLEPLKRPITIEDLLRHTSGMTYGFYGEAVRQPHATRPICSRGDPDNAELTRADQQAAARRAAGHVVGLQLLDRRARPRHRGGDPGKRFSSSRSSGCSIRSGMSETAFYLAYRVKGR